MTYRSHNVGPSRAFDHIYDPLYVASDRKDVCRANHAALAKSAPIGIFPVYQSMFSELPRLTRNHYVMHRNPLPYHPAEVQVTSLRPAYGGCEGHVADTSRVLGAERAKFFCHPNAGETGCNVRWAAEQYGGSVGGEQDQSAEYCGCDYEGSTGDGGGSGQPRFREVASQTAYRESSAQTQPWMPTAVLKESVMPAAEIVYVAEMLQHTRFPGVNEVEIVERARRKRTWEYALGACDSADEWRQQKLVLQIFEWEEWVARERQIDRYQMLRLQLVAKIMEKRERDTHRATEGKMENTKRRINEARNQAMQKLDATFERNLRKLERKRYEQSVRHGAKGDWRGLDRAKNSQALEAFVGGRKKYSKQSYDYDPNLIEVGLAKLEKKTAVTHKFVNPRDQRPELWKPKEVCREFQKGFWSDNFLRKLYESLKQFRNRKDSERSVPQCMIVVSSPTESLVVSPVAVSPERENDALYQQAVLVQKLIRGRATQLMIHRDYASEHDLMEDLIASHRLPVVEEFFPVEAPGGSTLTTGSVRERYLHILKNEQLLDAFIEGSSHAQMSSLMNTLERELTRLQNERNTQAFYLLAEQERYGRESSQLFDGSSTGGPPSDRKTPGAQDEMAIYLENALLEQADNVDEMREKIHQLARKFDEEADRRSDGSSLLAVGGHTDSGALGGRDDPGTIAGSLGDEMLLPDLFRRAARENIKFKQRTLLANVHELIYNRQEDDDVETRVVSEVGPNGDQGPPVDQHQPEEKRVVDGLLDGIIDRAVQLPPVGSGESAYSENEVEELPEDEEEMAGSDFYGLGFDGAEMEGNEQEAEEEEEIGRMANDLIEDILSQVLDVSEEDNAAVQ